MAIPVPFCGWRGRRFYFRTRAVSMKLEGPRAAIQAELRRCLPKYLVIAERFKMTELATMIRTELDALPEVTS